MPTRHYRSTEVNNSLMDLYRLGLKFKWTGLKSYPDNIARWFGLKIEKGQNDPSVGSPENEPLAKQVVGVVVGIIG